LLLTKFEPGFTPVLMGCSEGAVPCPRRL